MRYTIATEHDNSTSVEDFPHEKRWTATVREETANFGMSCYKPLHITERHTLELAALLAASTWLNTFLHYDYGK
jgi:hypothetical protein